MIGAIILTADNYHEVRVINIYKKNKNNSLFMPFFLLWDFSFSLSLFIKKIFYNFIFSFFYFKNKPKSNLFIPFFYHEVNTDLFYLEIILAFPFTSVLQKNQNIGKNNLLAFLYILIVGFIYELKEGALNIVKKPYVTEININQN